MLKAVLIIRFFISTREPLWETLHLPKASASQSLSCANSPPTSSKKPAPTPRTPSSSPTFLTTTDLRGVHSHGTWQIHGYAHMMLEGRVNPRPNIKVTSATTTARVYDGDGGMGHFPCHQAMTWVAETAAEYGTAAATTRNHFHFGSAGKYSRIAAAAGCVGIAISSHRYDLPPESIIKGVNATSPISIAFPQWGATAPRARYGRAHAALGRGTLRTDPLRLLPRSWASAR